jgi:serine/threonine protein kinase
MQELLGLMPKHIALSGRESKNYFNRKGELRFIKQLNFWSLKDVLIEKYHFSEKEATEISDFMLPMLNFSPARRATAQQMLQHPWIRNIDIDNFESAFEDSS